MDAEAFLDLANQVAKLKMYPYFDLAHAVVCCLAIKEDMGSGMKTDDKNCGTFKMIFSRQISNRILVLLGLES